MNINNPDKNKLFVTNTERDFIIFTSKCGASKKFDVNLSDDIFIIDSFLI